MASVGKYISVMDPSWDWSTTPPRLRVQTRWMGPGGLLIQCKLIESVSESNCTLQKICHFKRWCLSHPIQNLEESKMCETTTYGWYSFHFVIPTVWICEPFNDKLSLEKTNKQTNKQTIQIYPT